MTSQPPFARSGTPIDAVKSTFSNHFGAQTWEIRWLIAHQITVTATFPLHHRHQRLILHKICHFQPFVKLKLSKTFSWGRPFAKMQKNEPFSGLRNGRLRCVRSIVSGTSPLSLKCLNRTFNPSNFLCRQNRRWPAVAFQLMR